MIKKLILITAVAAFFVTGMCVAVSPFMALKYAERGDYRMALRLDPLDAGYYAMMGQGYVKEGRSSGNEDAVRKAKAAYERAIALCPTNSSYYLGWAEAEAMLLAKRGVVPAADIDTYVGNLRKAVEYNPNYYFTNAAAGYYLLLFRARINSSDRNFAIYRLRYALELNPKYCNEVFSFVANGLGDYTILQQITPRSEAWQKRMIAFLRNIDK